MDKLESLQDMDFGDAPGDDNEEADETEEAVNELVTAQILERRLMDIEDALKRIDGGTYGKCIRCGEDLSQEMLEASPESGLCKACKTG